MRRPSFFRFTNESMRRAIWRYIRHSVEHLVWRTAMLVTGRHTVMINAEINNGSIVVTKSAYICGNTFRSGGAQ
jgi:hypothetical protein